MLPCAGRSPTGRVDTAATRLTRCLFPGWRTKLVGVEKTRTSAAPSACRRTSTRTRSGRDDTLRTTTSCQRCQGATRAFPNASVVGVVASSPADAAPSATSPAPSSVTAADGSRRAVPVRTLRSADASSSGRASASTAAAPATAAAAALDPLTVVKRPTGSPTEPGVAVAIATPGATTSGLTRPS